MNAYKAFLLLFLIAALIYSSYSVPIVNLCILAFLEPESEIGQVIEETEWGFVLPNPTGEEVAPLIRELMTTPEQLRAMRANGYDAFRQAYTLAQAVERYSTFLQKHFGLIGEGKAH